MELHKKPGRAKIIKRIQFDPEFMPVSLGPIIKKREITALQQAKRIVSKAREEATRLRQEAKEIQEDSVEEKASERERGFEEGRQEGLGQVTEQLVQIRHQKEKILSEAEPQIIRMVMDIVEKIIGRDLEKGLVVDVVKKAITQAVGRRIVVKVHPDDLETLKARQEEFKTILDQNQTLTFREDETVSRGGSLVETEMGSVDARLETQLASIKKALGLGE